VSLASFTKHLERIRVRRRKKSKQQKKHKTPSLKSLSTWFEFGAWEDWLLWLCLWSVFFALVLNEKCERFEWWLGVFIASNHFLVVGWLCCRWAHLTVRWCTGHYTVQCPVRTTSADRWGLELLTVEVLCPLAAPDSPVRSDFADWLLTSALFTVPQSSQSTIGQNDWEHLEGGWIGDPVKFNN
jgi:hypothetical protein